MTAVERVRRAAQERVEVLYLDYGDWRDLIAALREHPTGYQCLEGQPPYQAMVYGVTVRLRPNVGGA